MLRHLSEYLVHVEACLKSYIWELSRRRLLILALFAYPYMLTGFVLFFGSMVSGGNYRYFAERTGVEDPLLYFIASSAVMIASIMMMEDVGAFILWESHTGTLEYVLLTPASDVVHLLAMPVPHIVFGTGSMVLSMAPLVLVTRGLRGLASLLATFLVLAVGLIPLAGFSVVVGGLSLRLKESYALIGLFRPLVLVLSGAMYPVTLLPWWLRAISMLIPITYSVECVRLIVAASPEARLIVSAIGTLLALSLVYNPLGVKVYTWLSSEARRKGTIGGG